MISKFQVGDKVRCVPVSSGKSEVVYTDRRWRTDDNWASCEGVIVTVDSVESPDDQSAMYSLKVGRNKQPATIKLTSDARHQIRALWWPEEWLEKYIPTKPKALKALPTKPSGKVKLAMHDIIGQDKAKKHIKIAVQQDMPVLLVGDTGTGKTTIVKDLADQQNKKWVRFNLTGETSVDEFVGKYVLEGGETKWQDGILLYAMKNGLWLIVDEINVALPEILFVLHSLLDDERAVLVSHHEGEVVKPHPDFRFFATMNPVDEYAGTKDLNKAFKSRFGMILELNYPTPAQERKIVEGKGQTSPEVASLLVDIGTAIRRAKKADQVFFTCSTRDLIQTAQLVEPVGLADALTIGIVNKANGDGTAIKTIIREMVEGYQELMAENYEIALETAIELRKAETLLRIQEQENQRKLKDATDNYSKVQAKLLKTEKILAEFRAKQASRPKPKQVSSAQRRKDLVTGVVIDDLPF